MAAPESTVSGGGVRASRLLLRECSQWHRRALPSRRRSIPPVGLLVARLVGGLIYWCDDRRPTGEAFLRLLADGYATHPDYCPEWHRIS